MERKDKINALVGYFALTLFLAGTFIPLTPDQKRRQYFPVTDLPLWNFHTATALCLLMLSFVLLQYSYRWAATRSIGAFYVISSTAWLARELCGTADFKSHNNTILGICVALILFFQYRYRNK